MEHSLTGFRPFARYSGSYKQTQHGHDDCTQLHSDDDWIIASQGGMIMNAIQLLMNDHMEASGLMEQIEIADKGDRSTKELFNQLKQALTVHTEIEEKIFYPELKKFDETKDLIPEAFEEHQEVKDILAEMSTLSPADDEFMDKLTELRDGVEHHVEEEENEMFPKAEKVLGQSRLEELGRQLEQMKQSKSATATSKS
jgi:Hemerythrin HHE cation binding domain.